jgi:uncharacterized protein YcbX
MLSRVNIEELAMTSHVHALRFYPLKGAAAIGVQSLVVNPVIGVPNDRRYALRRRPGDISARPEKFNKFDYVVAANTAEIVLEKPVYGDSYSLQQNYLHDLRDRMHDGVRLQDSGGAYHLSDTAGAQVSFINLATVRALEEFIGSGIGISQNRFRMNVDIEGLPAFKEYTWVDGYPGTREIMVGQVRMRVDDACERCKAPDANPDTGVYDHDIRKPLMAMMEKRGYRSPHRGTTCVMGFYGVVLNEGTIVLNDEIRLL